MVASRRGNLSPCLWRNFRG